MLTISLIGYGCANHDSYSQEKAEKDSITKAQRRRRDIDSIMALGMRPDSEQLSPSIQEERIKFVRSYDKIIKMDTLFIDGADTLSFSLKYYCQNNLELVVPKNYVFEGEKPKAFVTHPFACDIKILQQGKTIIEKTIDRSTFDAILWDQLKKYAILMEPSPPKYDQQTGDITMDCSISIPVTDVGMGAQLKINKNGTLKVSGN